MPRSLVMMTGTLRQLGLFLGGPRFVVAAHWVSELLAVLGLSLISGCLPLDQPPTLSPYRTGHPASGIVFPSKTAEFVFRDTHTYDKNGEDLSANFDCANPTNPVTITMYVYPAPTLVSIGSSDAVIATARKRLTDDHFEKIKQQLRAKYPIATLEFDQETTWVFAGKQLYGREAVFHAQKQVSGLMQYFVTRVEIYAYGEWLIKLRVTHPLASKASASLTIAQFKKDFAKINDRLGH